MPELPEVETVRRQLNNHVLNKTIVSVEVRNEKIVNNDKNFAKKLLRTEITEISRRGKLLIFKISSSKKKMADELFLLAHLKMTGQFVYEDIKNTVGGGHFIKSQSNYPHKHTHIIFEFKDGSHLYFNDLRRFGYVKFASKEAKNLAENKFGIEPGLDNYTLENFAKIFNKKSEKTLKALLLDQTKIAGLGNIYVDEACFMAGVLPTRKIKNLKKIEISKLFETCQEILLEAIKNGGTTFSDFRQVDGTKGTFRDKLQVFARQNKSCLRCGDKIKKIKCAGRGTHFCSKCQQ